jgi:hypothetical protein
MDALIRLLQRRIAVRPSTDWQQHPPIVPRPPVSLEELRRFERDTGLSLPPFLVQLYTMVANGGFGPSWGVNPLRHETRMSIETWDRHERHRWDSNNPPSGWPDPLIRFCEEGCNIYYGVDCSSDHGTVFVVDPTCGSDDPLEWLTKRADSVAGWLSEWVARPPPQLQLHEDASAGD